MAGGRWRTLRAGRRRWVVWVVELRESNRQRQRLATSGSQLAPGKNQLSSRMVLPRAPSSRSSWAFCGVRLNNEAGTTTLDLSSRRRPGMALAGFWGPDLIRIFHRHEDRTLTLILSLTLTLTLTPSLPY